MLAALQNRPAFGPCMVWMGGNHAYEPAALAAMAFGLTWTAMAVVQTLARRAKHLTSGQAAVAIHPQALIPCPPEAGPLTGTVRQIEFLGAFTRLHVACAGLTVQVDCLARDIPHRIVPGHALGPQVAPQDCIVMA